MKGLDMLTLKAVVRRHSYTETNVHLADTQGSAALVQVQLSQYDKLVEDFNRAADALHHFQCRAEYSAALNGIDIDAEITNLTSPNGTTDTNRE